MRLSGRLLEATGCVEGTYTERMIATCKELGPYIAVAPGIAIPHARPEDGAKEVCLAMVVIRSGVNFGSHNDPVYVVIAFSSPDKQSHLKILQELAVLLSEKGSELVSGAKKVSVPQELKGLIAQFIG